MRVVPLLLSACLHRVESDDTGGPGPTGEELSVVLSGSTVCGACEGLDDALVYQTPSSAVLSVRAVEPCAMTVTPEPVRLLDQAEGTSANLGTSTTLYTADTSEIPEGSYTQVALELMGLALEVDAIAHLSATESYPGVLGIDLALADGAGRDQGEYQAEVSVYGTSVGQDAELDVKAVPAAAPCVLVDTSGGAYRVVLKTAEPIEVSWSEPASVKVSVTAFSEQSFGWRDQDQAGYHQGELDVGFPPNTEVPEFAFLRGYSLSVDGSACAR